jgi:hypothetical protein
MPGAQDASKIRDIERSRTWLFWKSFPTILPPGVQQCLTESSIEYAAQLEPLFEEAQAPTPGDVTDANASKTVPLEVRWTSDATSESGPATRSTDIDFESFKARVETVFPLEEHGHKLKLVSGSVGGDTEHPRAIRNQKAWEETLARPNCMHDGRELTAVQIDSVHRAAANQRPV